MKIWSLVIHLVWWVLVESGSTFAHPTTCVSSFSCYLTIYREQSDTTVYFANFIELSTMLNFCEVFWCFLGLQYHHVSLKMSFLDVFYLHTGRLPKAACLTSIYDLQHFSVRLCAFTCKPTCTNALYTIISVRINKKIKVKPLAKLFLCLNLTCSKEKMDLAV